MNDDPSNYDIYKAAQTQAELELMELMPKLKQMKAHAAELIRAIESLHWITEGTFHPNHQDLFETRRKLGQVTFKAKVK